MNRPDFSYDVETDPLFSQYRKQYLREGQRAAQDTMGQAAAMSGGLPTSYAATAAGQAQNYYNAQLTDKVPELEQYAYQKYMNDFDMDRTKLGAVQDAEQADYRKYLDQLSQYNTDRSFAYGQHMDEVGHQRQNEANLWDRAQVAAGYGDYSRLNDLGVDTSGYQSQQDRQRAWEEALQRAQFGDYSGLQGLGVDTTNDPTNWERQMQEAQLWAQYGDLSRLRSMGVDTSAYEAQLAAKAAGSGGGGGGGNGSGSGAGTQDQAEYVSTYSRLRQQGIQTAGDAFDYCMNVLGMDRLEAKQQADYFQQQMDHEKVKGAGSAIGDFAKWLTGKGGDQEQADMGKRYQEIYNTARDMYARSGNVNEIVDYLNRFGAGDLTDAGISAIFDRLGIQ